ncbi:PAS domain-containing sensor histidine kinase [Caldimonas brevitalea]|uniref:Sensor histidine kinase n=1 Tax=Caldimonas brevitalea TaxID=413882 RepID=A0A0G3BJD8_9BURK|nr:PAS domain-containing sensor histidine kinase [Caldimonas brevitalea]AKJ29492.1 sensor histidine kinase [Caldimonas brevitalea]
MLLGALALFCLRRWGIGLAAAAKRDAVVLRQRAHRRDLLCNLATTRMSRRNLMGLQPIEARYQAMVELSPDAIWIIEAGRIGLVNRSCLDLLGSDEAAGVIGQDPLAYFLEEDRPAVAALMQQALARGRAAGLERCIRRPDGCRREVEVSAAALPDHAQTLEVVLRDVTQRNETARLLEQSGEELRRLSRNLLDVREEERRHISRELHDELGQRLSAIRMEVASLVMAPVEDDDLGRRVAEAVRMIDETVASVRRIAADLRPAMLDDLGLEAAVEWLAQDWSSRTGLQIDVLYAVGETQVSDAAKTAAYRIVQEALTNVSRHARARRVSIALRLEHGRLAVSVEDDGRGMSASALPKPRSYGLIGMRERALQLGGSVSLQSSPGLGTRVQATLPAAASAAGAQRLRVRP